MRPSRRCLAAALAVVFASVASGSSRERLDVASLVNGADLIVIGQIASLSDTGTDASGARVFQGAISIDAVIKGPQIGVARFTSAQRTPLVPTAADDCEVFFLKHGATEFQFVSADYASVPAVCGLELRPASSPLQQVTTALGAVAQAKNLRPDVRLRAISALAAAAPDAAVAILKRVLRDPDRDIQGAAATVLLRLGDTTPLPLVEGALVRPESEVSADPVASSLRDAVARIDDPRAIPVLARLLAAPDALVRRAAVLALGHTTSPLAVVPLTSALDDGDLDVRYAAVQAFAEVAGAPEWSVDVDRFRAEPDRYVSHWREWVASRAR